MSSTPALPDCANRSSGSSSLMWPKRLSRWLMVTTTTSPSRASTVPSKPGAEPARLSHAPPCSPTITRRLPVVPAVRTLRERQSSVIACSAPYQAPKESMKAGNRGAEAPNAVAFRTPSQGAAGAGRQKRFDPAMEATYGNTLETADAAGDRATKLPARRVHDRGDVLRPCSGRYRKAGDSIEHDRAAATSACQQHARSPTRAHFRPPTTRAGRRRKTAAHCDHGARCASKKHATSEW